MGYTAPPRSSAALGNNGRDSARAALPWLPLEAIGEGLALVEDLDSVRLLVVEVVDDLSLLEIAEVVLTLSRLLCVPLPAFGLEPAELVAVASVLSATEAPEITRDSVSDPCKPETGTDPADPFCLGDVVWSPW